MLQPVRRRTWAPSGHTPVMHAWDRRDRLSAIGAISVSPRRRHLGHYFQLLDRNVTGQDLEGFIKQLHRQLARPIILVWDRFGPHRWAAKKLLAKHSRWLDIEWLPPYAPDLNPVEQCWNHTKYADLANFIPEDIHDLHRAVQTSFHAQRSNSQLLRSYFNHAGLHLGRAP